MSLFLKETLSSFTLENTTIVAPSLAALTAKSTDLPAPAVKNIVSNPNDVKTYRRGHPVLIKKIPSGFGHEFSGVITKVGKDVVGFKEGDRVVAANSAPCGKCFFCKRGEYNQL